MKKGMSHEATGKRIFYLALCSVLYAFDVSAQVQQPDKTQVGFLSGHSRVLRIGPRIAGGAP
jgi:hypothetical protein